MRLTRSPVAWSGVLLLVAGSALTFAHLAGTQDQPVEIPRADEPVVDPEDYSTEVEAYYDLILSQGLSETREKPAGERRVEALDVRMPYPLTDVEVTLALDAPAWSPLQATGAPNVEQGGDNPHAWAPLTEDGQPEWLELEWKEPVRAAALLVYESCNPGALIRVRVNGDDIQETTIFDSADPVHVSEGKGVAIIPVTVDSPIKYVRLEFDSPAFPGWNEVDAVGLVELVSGEVHWAVGAQASSTYADRTQLDHGEQVLSLELVHRAHGDRLAALCTHCHKDPHAAMIAPEQCPEFVRSLELLRGDRRQRIESLRHELQRLEQEEAVEQEQQSILRETQTLLERMAAEQSSQADSQRIQEYEDAFRRQAKQEALRQDELLKLRALEAARRAEAEAEAARRQADLQKRYEAESNDGIEFVDPEPVPGDAVVNSQQLLEELQRSLQQQQQAIDRLAQILESLQMQLRPADPERSPDPDSSGPDAESSDDAGTPGESSANDAAYFRRILLDVQGLHPTPEVMQLLLDNPSESERQQLEVLLEFLRSSDPPVEAPADPGPSSN